jgi:protein involved in polysaccharide export with SLBB domain
MSAYEAYQRQFQNQLGVADTLTEKLMAQSAAARSGNDAQALESAVDPKTYKLGPGDAVFLDVFAVHSLDQDLTVTPDGKLIVPKVGDVEVDGLTVVDAEKKLTKLFERDYRIPELSLSLRKLRTLKVSVLGEVLSPGVQSATAMQRLSEVAEKAGGFTAHSSLRNIEVRRQDGSLRVRADLDRYFSGYDLTSNPTVESGDVIVIPKISRFLTISGAVVTPGTFEYHDGDSLSTLIMIARGLLPDAKTDSVEISRFDPNSPSEAHRFYVNFKAKQDVILADGDAVFIRSITKYHVQRIVSVGGEVAFPGRYSIDPGKTRLGDIIQRAGGALPTASLEESILLRRVGVGSWEQDAEWVRLSEMSKEQKDRMSDDEYNYYTARLRQMGRNAMVVDFKALIENHDENQNILLREEDSIWFPRARGFVNVTGSVNNQGDVLLIENGTYLDYIRKAGGFTSSADHSGVRVINSRTGSYVDPTSDKVYKIGPGDTIVVPAERSEFWKNFALATAITAQILTIAAGVLLILQKR